MRVRVSLSVLLVSTLNLSFFQVPAAAQAPGQLDGFIAGKVYDRDGTTPLKDAVVTAHMITTNQRLVSVPTDGRGNFVIKNARSGIFAFTVTYKGQEYPVAERLDARVRMVTPEGTEIAAKMTFLLEVCFRKDKDDPREKTALVVRGECKPELPALLAAAVRDQVSRGLLILISGGAVAGTTLGVLAVTGRTEASTITQKK